MMHLRLRRPWSIWGIVTVLLGLPLSSSPEGACQGARAQGEEVRSAAGSRRPAVGRLMTIRLVPEDVTLRGDRASQRFLVLGKFQNGLDRDLTGKAQYSLRNPEVAQLGRETQKETPYNLRVVALSNGKTALTAVVAGKTAEARIRVEEVEKKRPSSFVRDISGILTKLGCNSSHCHGGVKGKGGFKLSLNALYPRGDYPWIVEGGTYQVLTTEPGGERYPRINFDEPEKSLLLLKPTARMPHGGGERLKESSADYETILNWVKNGATYGDEDEGSIRVERIEVFPRELVLLPREKHRLLVSAYLSNGLREDITDQVNYVADNPEVVKVSPEGVVHARTAGEAVVLVGAAGHAVSVHLGVIDRLVDRYPQFVANNFIDKYIFARLRKFNIVPSELSSDAEFLRRVCLDVTGTLPPPGRVREFLASKDPRKRNKLIEILLNSLEYQDFWTFRFSDLFRTGGYIGLESPEVNLYSQWVRKSIAHNKPYEQIARERIAALGFDGPSRHYTLTGQAEKGRFEKVMAEQVRVFWGRRLDCAQCHDHPYDAWTQDQFWGLAAFFARRTQTTGKVIFEDPEGHEKQFGETGDTSLAFIKAIHPRTKQEVRPTFSDGTVLPQKKTIDLRMELAKWMTSHPYFAEAAVNRVWGYFFGRGIVDPVDDFRLTNPPTHPILLQALAQDFREHGHDLKRLIRFIVESRTYQSSSIPTETNRDDRSNYSRALPRPMEAEVLLDAISAVTGVPEIFERGAGKAPPGSRAINLSLPAKYTSIRFLEIYGAPLRDVLPERDSKPNLFQALHMLVGSTYTEKLSKEGGRLGRLLQTGASDREIIEELFLAALSRLPTEGEQAELQEMIAHRPARRATLEDLVWALVSSREFAYNH